MPLPIVGLVMAAAGGAVGVEVMSVVKSRIKKALDENWREYLNAAMDDLGIVIDPDEGINDESLTKAINVNLLGGTGVELASVLDRKKMIHGFEGLALQKISADLGMAPVTSVSAIRPAVQGWLLDTLGAEIAMESGDVIDAAKPLQSVADKIAATPDKLPWNRITDFTDAGEKNRARQAKYRRSHSKYWVEK